MEYGDLKGPLEAIIRILKSIDRRLLCEQCGSELASIAGTQADADPTTIVSGYRTLRVTKTSAGGTVTIALPEGGNYVLSANGEVFEIVGSPLGEFTVTGAGGATYKYYAY